MGFRTKEKENENFLEIVSFNNCQDYENLEYHVFIENGLVFSLFDDHRYRRDRMSERRTILKIGVFVLCWLAIAAVIFYGLSYFEWQHVLNNQWIKDSITHYEWWEFFFAWGNAWAWLWYTNYSAWAIWALVLSVIVGFIAALIIAFVFIDD